MTVSPALGKSITVTLIPTVEADLQLLTERTEMSPTDITNRAITLYEFFDAQQRAGRDMLARDRKTGETLLIQLTDAATTRERAAWPGWDTSGAPQPGPVVRRCRSFGGPAARLLPVGGGLAALACLALVGLGHAL